MTEVVFLTRNGRLCRRFTEIPFFVHRSIRELVSKYGERTLVADPTGFFTLVQNNLTPARDKTSLCFRMIINMGGDEKLPVGQFLTYSPDTKRRHYQGNLFNGIS